MKCSVNEIDAGNAAVTAERDRLQRVDAKPSGVSRPDPFLRALPKVPEPPGRVEMLVEGLAEIERESE